MFKEKYWKNSLEIRVGRISPTFGWCSVGGTAGELRFPIEGERTGCNDVQRQFSETVSTL